VGFLLIFAQRVQTMDTYTPKVLSIEPTQLKNQAYQFLSDSGVKGTVLYCQVTGSYAYNLAHEDSDVDYLGVYVFDTLEFLSLNNNLPREALATQPETHPDRDDISLHEIGHFAQLLAKGNPFMVESLFAEKNVYRTPHWEKLTASIRNTTLNQRTVEQYLSYCKHQWKRHEKKPLPGKRLYHIVRLLYEALNIIEGRTPCVFFPEGPQLELMKKIRTESLSGESLQKKVDDLFLLVEGKDKSHLLAEPDEELISDWLVATRLNFVDAEKAKTLCQ